MLWNEAVQKLQATKKPPFLHVLHLPIAGGRRLRWVDLQTCCSESALVARAAPTVNGVTSPGPIRLKSVSCL